MTKTALILGGTGQIGIASARALAHAGYHVTAAHRGERPLPSGIPAEAVRFDREDSAALVKLASGKDLVVDTIAYSPDHARQLGRLVGDIGSLVVISTGSVYLGRNNSYFDIAHDDESYPDFPVPITEESPTIDNGEASYGPLKAAMERTLLDIQGLPVSILRPAAVHGPFSPKLREFYFMKRVLDGRRHAVLSRNGSSRFSTSSTLNIAALVVACARTPGAGAFNAVDEENLSVREIAETVFDVMGHDAAIHGFEGAATDELGATPWDAARPFVCDMTRAREVVGYVPAVSYRDSIAIDLEWLLEELGNGRAWQELFPSVVSRYGENGWFPYEKEDQWIASEAGH